MKGMAKRCRLAAEMRDAAVTFRRSAEGKREHSSEWLADNFYILERTAKQSAADCRSALKTKIGSELLPSLFSTCREICGGGVLPDEDEMIKAFPRGLGGFEAELLPIALTAALISYACEGVTGDNQKLLGNSVTSLRRLGEMDFEKISATLLRSEPALAADPSGIYPVSDERSKAFYRRVVASAARRSGKSEEQAAEELIGRLNSPKSHPKRLASRGRLFLIMEAVMPLAAAFGAGMLMRNITLGLLLWLPLWEIMRRSIEKISLKGVAPGRLLRLKPDDPRVLDTHALITVSTLLPPPEKIGELEKHLEQLYLGNCIGNIKICCLADHHGAPRPSMPEDKAALNAAVKAFDRLNSKYGGGFILAVRRRTYSRTQNEFTGKERKRGAITDLVAAIKGDGKAFACLHGDRTSLHKVKYLIALDSDTGLAFDGARLLVAAAEHPANRPIIDGGRVVKGYGIIAPAAENRLDGGSSAFARVMTGQSGFSSYDLARSERYQDLFGEGIFCGKGLISVEAYHALIPDVFPEETVLSHDILEGCLLRTAFMPDVQITDAFPQSVGSYFAREHRWIRGDWQNLGFIFGRNSLSALSRYKLFDNLRRSVTPVVCLALILASVVIQGEAGVTVAVISLLALAAGDICAGLSALISGGLPSMSRLFFSRSLPEALGGLSRTFIDLALSAKRAYIALNAIVKAVWRRFVSGKNMLEWVTASNSEREGSTVGLLISCIPSAAAAAVMLIAGLPMHRLYGLILLADIPLTLFAGRRSSRSEKQLSPEQRERLLDHCAAMWGFFDEQCGRENNFLPPDNIQFAPVRATARRTSPTNIGLMLLSFLAARDLGFITSAELHMRLNLSLGTVEKLEKYHGSLLNWYNTETLEPLEPCFVSFVDSGNFLCCLVALRQGLREYAGECPSLGELISRIERLEDATELQIFRNERKKLFAVGIDPATGERSGSCYDFFMTEARTAVYYAVARRIVPPEYWGSMSRLLVASGRYAGAVSWTGTMFEYFMPDIFLPSPPGSLSYESLHFCLYCQRKRAGRRPFGVSESGFYAFDGDLNYQYKAHGVQRLGLRRGLDNEYVVSPYSSFLVLSAAPKAAMTNLKRLENMGLGGKYGLCEAADFTPSRCGGAGFAAVRSYMAHHVGMSLLAADNLLTGQKMQRRFMSDGFMSGASGLLEEKIPADVRAFKDIRSAEVSKPRERVRERSVISPCPDPTRPRTALYTNGRLTCCISDIGTSLGTFDGYDVNAADGDPIGRPQGVFALFTGDDGRRMPFIRAIDTDGAAKFSCEFVGDRAIHTAAVKGMRLTMQSGVMSGRNCEVRRFTVENQSRREQLSGRLTVYFEPCLDKKERFAAHPMYSKLFLIDEFDRENGCAVFGRRDGSACAAAAGFIEDGFAFEGARERVLSTPRGVFSLGERDGFAFGRGNPDACCAFERHIELAAGGKGEFTLLIAVDETAEQAVGTFAAAKSMSGSKRLSKSPLLGDRAAEAVLGEMLPAVLYPRLFRKGTVIGDAAEFTREDIWSFGISGDLPILLMNFADDADQAALRPYIVANRLLRSCGLRSDLVIAYSGTGEYGASPAAKLRSLAAEEGCELMIGIKGGIHLVDIARHSYRQRLALEHMSICVPHGAENTEKEPQKPFKPLPFHRITDKKNSERSIRYVKRYSFTDSEITIEKGPATVDIPWNIVLANKSCGTMQSDKSLGFTWALNSRENKLTPWYNDTLSDNCGEMLIMKYEGALYDIAALGTVTFTPNKAVWRVTVGGVDIEAVVETADRGCVKRCSVEAVNRSGSIRSFDLFYYVLPVLGISPNSPSVFFARRTDHGALLRNALAEFPGSMYLQCSAVPEYVTFSRRDFFEGKLNSNENVPADCCAAVGKRLSLAAGGRIRLDFTLSWGANADSALKLPEIACFTNGYRPPRLHSGYKKFDLFANSFLYSQIKVCRFLGRTGFYQCSGAYGFRDQLQDCLAFLKTEPQLARTHLLRCAAVQFEQGDVLHWWHVIVNGGQKIRGVRTRCSDDMLWLPYACAEYAAETGDYDIFDEKVPFISGAALPDGVSELYMTPSRTAYKGTMLEHCIKAVDRSLNFGVHGLPLIGSCDWNDGFSRLGSNNDCESVWLAMFQVGVLRRIADICTKFDMKDRKNRYITASEELERKIQTIAWRGDRYARAIFADGSSLGEEKDFIDILPQAFAVLLDIGDSEKAKIAVNTAYERLFCPESGVTRLLAPAFDESEAQKVGYIAEYPEGIRENSGQYTHAAVWLARALLKIGEREKGMKVLDGIVPIGRYDNPETAAAYRAEPYLLAGDISCGNGINGRAGWTNYTGSAAWLYRTFADIGRSEE